MHLIQNLSLHIVAELFDHLLDHATAERVRGKFLEMTQERRRQGLRGVQSDEAL